MDFLGQLTDKMAAADLSFTCSVYWIYLFTTYLQYLFTIFLDHEHFILSFVFHSREMFKQIVVRLISYSVPEFGCNHVLFFAKTGFPDKQNLMSAQ